MTDVPVKRPKSPRDPAQLTMWGFGLIYFSVMTAMLTASMPALAGMQHELRWYGLLPMAATGVALLAYGRLIDRESA